MKKFVTRDGVGLKLNIDKDNEELIRILSNIIPRLSYEEIQDGELEKRLKDVELEYVKLSSGEDIKKLFLSNAIFNAISKPPGF
ncbi:MAG: hypothetical protein E7220_01760 [Clostridiales bacterium]|nr:hypothetical protein [Clostridiales bacterium]